MSDASAVVTFDYPAWAMAYPVVAATVSLAMAQQYFATACLYCDNSPTSPILNAAPGGTRESILWMLTAHVAVLFANGGTGLVGRITNASQGSVNVAVDMPTTPSAAWFNQTIYGAAAWQAMAPFRQGAYWPAPQIPLPYQSFPGPGGVLPFNGGFPWPR